MLLRPMTEEEFPAFVALSQEGYARERALAFDTPLDEERAIAKLQYGDLLKDGIRSPGHRLWRVVLDDQAAIGHLWAFVDADGRRAFIYDVYLDEAHRGKGHGKNVLALLEKELVPLGVQRVGLNVFATNRVAFHLYEMQGYQVTNYQMQKRLGAG